MIGSKKSTKASLKAGEGVKKQLLWLLLPIAEL